MNWRQWAIEVAITTMLLGGLCWSIPPDVNESHYLTKAKHLWNGSRCGEDLILNSFDTHWVSFATLGFPTLFFDLSTSAWLGRITCWLVLAISFVRLSRVWTGRQWLGCVIGPAAVLLNQFGHWSGEWFCGGAEGKTISYGFVILALSFAMENRWRSCWAALGIASAFHILVGGWSMIAFFGAALILKLLAFRSAKKQNEESSVESIANTNPKIFPGILIGFALALPGLLPALLQNWNVDNSVAVQAAQVQVSSRISHHLNCNEFQTERHVAFFLTTFVFTAASVRMWPNSRFRFAMLVAISSLGLAAVGAVLSNHFSRDPESELTARLLTLYWFRTADVFLPVVVVLAFVIPRSVKEPVGGPAWIVEVLAAAIFLGVVAHAVKRTNDPRPLATIQSQSGYYENRQHAIEAHENWKKVCDWIRQNTPADAQFLTIRSQQTFKWYAGRGEVASWKDMPQDAESVVEWIGRFEQIYLRVPEEPYGLLSFLDSELIAISEQFDVDYLIVWQRHEDQRIQIGDPVSMERVYPHDSETKSTFVVFKFPKNR